MDFSMIGPAIVLGLGCLGSAIGCTIGGMAVHGVITHVDEGHGKFIGLSAMPSSQSIYALIMMIVMQNALRSGKISSLSGVGIGLFIGLALMGGAIYQGKCAATAIQATAKQPSVFGKAAAAPAIVESFSLFAFVFGLSLVL